MHISEGVLSPAVLGGGAVLSALGVYMGLRKLDYRRLLTVAVLSAAFFVGSLVHVPLGPGNVHLILNGLLGVFLGWAVFPALLVALLLQAVLFQYGGLAVLGVNVFDMAFPALVCHYAFVRMLGGPPLVRAAAAFCAGALSVALAGLLTALALGLSGEEFVTSAKVLLLAHLPIACLEGVITACVVSYIAKTRPELLPTSPAGGMLS